MRLQRARAALAIAQVRRDAMLCVIGARQNVMLAWTRTTLPALYHSSNAARVSVHTLRTAQRVLFALPDASASAYAGDARVDASLARAQSACAECVPVMEASLLHVAGLSAIDATQRLNLVTLLVRRAADAADEDGECAAFV
jgi:hypothetical protein